MSVFDYLSENPVIPVLVVENPQHAVPMAESLIKGGITALEVTLRTAAALDVVERIAKSLPEAKVGVGTLLQPAQFADAKNAGAGFAVSPGLTESLAGAAKHAAIPWLPGAATSSEVMFASELGIDELKFFPASVAGGPSALKGFASVFQGVNFCPTGGVNIDNMPDYLSLPNVKAVGGSWLVSHDMLQRQDWKTITKTAEEAVEIAHNCLTGLYNPLN